VSRVRTVRISSALLVVLLRFTDCPLEGRGQSVWYCAGLLSPFLLELCFRFGIVWGLSLGLVGPL
jgi:hypothetical protein